ncbi:hypothetical protein EX30DRAFT_395988 [Ascodesmis nigricans]|uniref:Phosphatidate phosphatase APP1 catalytic domain-containing protein n=1 Tax=Ascodesmis nigricans TaxID=341454 RepID=A0A4S2MW32_9PEZI|nr:hypothetical protein EX30DRAFT_395988 [Ascodesmis nigricans]
MTSRVPAPKTSAGASENPDIHHHHQITIPLPSSTTTGHLASNVLTLPPPPTPTLYSRHPWELRSSSSTTAQLPRLLQRLRRRLRASFTTARFLVFPGIRPRLQGRIYKAVVWLRSRTRPSTGSLLERSSRDTRYLRAPNGDPIGRSSVIRTRAARRNTTEMFQGSRPGGTDENTDAGWGKYYRAASQYAPSIANRSETSTPREPGARRKKLVGYLQAANELRQSYTAAYAARSAEANQSREVVGDDWPQVTTANADGGELMLFPSYARVRPPPTPGFPSAEDDNGDGKREEWRLADPSRREVDALIEVDVRGWLYIPHSGPMNRKSRYALWAARQLCGLPPEPSADLSPEEQQAAAAEFAAQSQPLNGGMTNSNPEVPAGGGITSRIPYWRSTDPANAQSTMTPAEIKAAHVAFNTRLAPFTYRPIANTPITIFFYNDTHSQSRQLLTSANGHFSLRAELAFIPTHVRVLATEHLSATEDVCLHPPDGISLISDIDDTVKHSAITMGTREVFRNTFTAPLPSLAIPGVAQWYRKLAGPPYNVSIHYISNSPWQLYPLLRSFFQETGLPAGSFHLKQYSGMLQGIFEPVAERKKGTVERVIMDFPHRKWILVGDSGEQDLEVYTEMAERWPEKILAICIRDITSTITPSKASEESASFFDSKFSAPPLPRRVNTDLSAREMGPLIDFPPQHGTPPPPQKPIPNPNPHRAPTPPQPPQKPKSLRGPPIAPKPANLQSQPHLFPHPPGTEPTSNFPWPRPPSRASTLSVNTPHSSSPSPYDGHEYPPPSHSASSLDPPTPDSLSSTPASSSSASSAKMKVANLAGLAGIASASTAAAGTNPQMQLTEQMVSKREDLWVRRWESARERLDALGVRLVRWRKGADVQDIVVDAVEKELGIGKGRKDAGRTGSAWNGLD